MKKAIEVTTKIDYTTGEVKETSSVRRYRGDEPNYIKLYLADISYMHGLPTTTSDVLNELLQYVTYGTQEIMLNSTAKKRIAEVTGMSPRTLDNRLQELAKSGIIHRVATGTYLLNPYLFGKGDWKTISSLRNKNIHLQIIYDKNTGERKLKGCIQEDKTTTLPTIEAEQCDYTYIN